MRVTVFLIVFCLLLLSGVFALPDDRLSLETGHYKITGTNTSSHHLVTVLLKNYERGPSTFTFELQCLNKSTAPCSDTCEPPNRICLNTTNMTVSTTRSLQALTEGRERMYLDIKTQSNVSLGKYVLELRAMQGNSTYAVRNVTIQLMEPVEPRDEGLLLTTHYLALVALLGTLILLVLGVFLFSRKE